VRRARTWQDVVGKDRHVVKGRDLERDILALKAQRDDRCEPEGFLEQVDRLGVDEVDVTEDREGRCKLERGDVVSAVPKALDVRRSASTTPREERAESTHLVHKHPSAPISPLERPSHPHT